MGNGCSTSVSPATDADLKLAVEKLPTEEKAKLLAALRDDTPSENVESLGAGSSSHRVAPPAATAQEHHLTEKEQQLLKACADRLKEPFELPTSFSEFVSFKELAVAKPLVDLCTLAQQQSRLNIVWAQLIPLMKRVLASVLTRTQTAVGRSLLTRVYEEKRQGSLKLYRHALDKCKRDPNYPELMRSVRALQLSLNALFEEEAKKRRLALWRRPSGTRLNPVLAKDQSTLRMRYPRQQAKEDAVEIIADAASLETRFNELLNQLAARTGASMIKAPLKNIWRVLEKTILDKVASQHEQGITRNTIDEVWAFCPRVVYGGPALAVGRSKEV